MFDALSRLSFDSIVGVSHIGSWLLGGVRPLEHELQNGSYLPYISFEPIDLETCAVPVFTSGPAL